MLSITFSFIILLIFILFAQATHQKENNQIKQNIKLEAKLVVEQIKLKLNENKKSLKRMANRFAKHDLYTKQEWMIDAKYNKEDLYGVLGIRWVDTNHIIKWIYPPMKKNSIVGKNITFEKNRRNAIIESMQKRKTVASHTIDLLQGDKGFLLLSPI